VARTPRISANTASKSIVKKVSCIRNLSMHKLPFSSIKTSQKISKTPVTHPENPARLLRVVIFRFFMDYFWQKMQTISISKSTGSSCFLQCY
jgi:hypothetical protein